MTRNGRCASAMPKIPYEEKLHEKLLGVLSNPRYAVDLSIVEYLVFKSWKPVSTTIIRFAQVMHL